jgi:hypothetical protein
MPASPVAPRIHTRRWLLGSAALVGGVSMLGVLAACDRKAVEPAGKAAPEDLRAIAKEAWIYAYPGLMNYQTLVTQTQDPNNPAYAGFGKFRHYSQFFTPANKDIVTPNNDTPYSWAWLDLRAEPWVLSVPAAPQGRYYVHQFMDLFTQIFGYVGVRATGRDAGSYLIAGPAWTGPTPRGINGVLRSESDLVVNLARTSMSGPQDAAALRAFQAQYKLEPLSTFAKTAPPPPAPPINFPPWDKAKALGPDFVGYLNFLLQFSQPTPAAEMELMARFAKVGVGPGKPFDLAGQPPVVREAIVGGAKDGAAALEAEIAKTTSSIGLFGSRDQLGSDYIMKRAVAAAMGIYGNAAEEAVYVGTMRDASGAPLDGANRYEVHLTKAQLPPAAYFWSVTMYNLPDRLLVENPIRRYSLGDRSDLKFAPDGSLTLYVQATSPGPDKESNWLPSPAKGPFNVVFRLYGPSSEAQQGKWPPPALTKVG